MTALSLSTVVGLKGKSSVALSADHFISVILSGEGSNSGFNGTTSKSEDQVKSGFLLDVVIGKGSAIFELLSSEDESLLIRGDTFLVLDLGLDVFNGIRGFDVKSDSLAGQSLDEDLHTTSKSQNQVKGGFLLDIVVGKSSAVFELLSGKDESLLIRGDTFLVLDLSLDVFNGVRGFDVKSDGLASQSLDEDLHTTSKSQNQMEG